MHLTLLDTTAFCSAPDKAEFFKLINHFRNLPKLYPAKVITASVLQNIALSYAIETNFIRRHGDKTQLTEVIGKTENTLHQIKNSSPFAFINRVVLASSYFAIGDTLNAEKHNSWTLNNIQKGLRTDLVHMSLCLDLLIHLDMGDNQYVANKSATLTRKFQKAEAPYKLELELLKTLKQLTTNAPLRQQTVRQLANLKSAIQSPDYPKNGGVLLQYIDLLSWVDQQTNILSEQRIGIHS